MNVARLASVALRVTSGFGLLFSVPGAVALGKAVAEEPSALNQLPVGAPGVGAAKVSVALVPPVVSALDARTKSNRWLRLLPPKTC